MPLYVLLELQLLLGLAGRNTLCERAFSPPFLFEFQLWLGLVRSFEIGHQLLGGDLAGLIGLDKAPDGDPGNGIASYWSRVHLLADLFTNAVQSSYLALTHADPLGLDVSILQVYIFERFLHLGEQVGFFAFLSHWMISSDSC
jgi:hypothetical protein